MDYLKIGNKEITVKEWNNQRVITLNDVDMVHERPEGTARHRMKDNRKRFIDGEDYFFIRPSDFQKDEKRPFEIPNRGLILLTESGYLMLVKSFTDDLAWEVQRQLVNTYFRFKQVVKNFNENYPIDTNELNKFLKEMPVMFAQINNLESMIENQSEQIEKLREEQNKNYEQQTEQLDRMENSISDNFDAVDEQSSILSEQAEKLEMTIDNMTLSTRQQEKIHEAARVRVNYLLGGAHSDEYKKNSRIYFINLWNGLKAKFHCGSSWKDLNPCDFENATQFIGQWEYVG